ncbi:ankyrin repeat ph and sec7 domain containing protein secg-related [Anaeramoeba ignava]|uniref:Ankyrin repeat ph and sec7 domain containing protein secg-related n=1 Tax=Anaeramoeba ignava TaxID=1746090 RepID=A0A9Q0RCM3_ANAIG|nr:ankyrin repeat ph and sec7 domain containing protein secg-related [Anaeramoeba ignava]
MNLQISCINGNLKEVKEILKSNNFESTNPIYFALTKNPNIEILSLLLERFDVNLITQQNQISCLILACRDCPKYDVIKLLIEKGADCSFQVKSTALHYALMSHAKYDVIELLIKSGCDLNHKTGYSPLHYACIFYNDPLIVDLIIKSGANIDDITGNTALHFACINKTHPDILHYLIKGGAQINKLNKVIFPKKKEKKRKE